MKGSEGSVFAPSQFVESAGDEFPSLRAAINDATSCGAFVRETDALGQALSEAADASNGAVTVKAYRGKVRDTYEITNADDGRRTLVLATTDRQSAFDQLLGHVPLKGRSLNLCSCWWLAEALDRHGIPNAAMCGEDGSIAVHPNVTIMRRCEMLPIEMVVRAYVTGSTETSVWTHYKRHFHGDSATTDPLVYCGHSFPPGLRKNDAIPMGPVVTPTTKGEKDEPISMDDAVSRGLLTAEQAKQAEELALRMFAFGQEEASKRGLVLVDTKYELGVDPQTGEIAFADEVHTPDSSRYWVANTYESRVKEQGLEPENIDKEFYRLWFAGQCDMYDASVEKPTPPPELGEELGWRYAVLSSLIRGDAVPPPARDDEREMVGAVLGALKYNGVL